MRLDTLIRLLQVQGPWRRVWVCVMLALLAGSAWAGVLTLDDLRQRYPAPLVVGERDTTMPVWPIFQQNGTSQDLVAYAFESIDLAPIPGFSGVPVNLLITLDASGNFRDVALVSEHEPVFLDGLGEVPLLGFLSQYRKLSLKQGIQIVTGSSQAKQRSASSVQIDGVSKATASVRIINQTILSAALKVARQKLGFGAGRDPASLARIKTDFFEPHSVDALIHSGLIKHVLLRNKDIERLFAASPGARLDPEALAQPNNVFLDLYLAYVSVPSIGRNLLSEASWRALQNRLEPGDHALLVMSKGRYSVLGEAFVPGSTPDRIALRQDRLSIDLRDLNLDLELAGAQAAALGMHSVAVFRIIGQAGLDPAGAFNLVLPLTRSKGQVYPERITREWTFDFTLPERFYTVAGADNKSWRATWRDRQADIALLLLGLAVLTFALLRQQRWAATPRRWARFRTGYLLFTLLVVGWYAQAQLSIVNLTSVLQAALAGRSLAFLLHDPMTVILASFVGVSLLFWGRGTFCGWLCPFGALQELTAKAGGALKLPQRRLKTATDARLKWLKYAILAAILVSAWAAPALTDRLVEVEPFKTAITLNFVRSWPFVLYALALLALGLWVYKFFCRFLCPLGAALALLGRVRRLSWIARRADCGAPCQTCRHQCPYQAIASDGRIQYDECFQCMDCVVIHASDTQCAPLMLQKKRARVIPIQTAPIDKLNQEKTDAAT